MSCINPKCLIDKMGCTSVEVYTGDMECEGPWRVLHRIGVHGAQGEVYKVCSPVSCEFAFKHIRNVEDMPIDMLHKEVLHEARIQKIAASHGIAPPVIEVILDENSGAIIMPQLTESMQQRYNKYVYYKDEGKMLNLVQIAYDLLSRLHSINITHKDMILDNLMCYSSADGQDRWYIIDYDRSQYIKDDGDKLYDILRLRSAFSNKTVRSVMPHIIQKINELLPRPDGKE